MTILIIIFILSVVAALGMLSYRAWQIESSGRENFSIIRKLPPEIYFRQIEKIMLYLTKHAVQSIILSGAKGWFTIKAKTSKWIHKNSPRIHKFFERKESTKKTFVGKAILESKIKIRRIKERIEKEIEED
jgi:hypothetical protein